MDAARKRIGSKSTDLLSKISKLHENSECLNYFIFFITFIISLMLCISNISDEDKDDKTFSIIMLVIVCLTVIALVGLWFFDYNLLLYNSLFLKSIVVIILILSYTLSITNMVDESQKNKSMPIMSLIITIIITLLAIFANFKM